MNRYFGVVTNPSNGSLSGLNTDTGEIRYTKNNGFYGTDSFLMEIRCGKSLNTSIRVQTFKVNVNVVYCVDAIDDSFVTNKNTSLTTTVVNNDKVCSSLNTYYSLVPGFTTNGTVTMLSNGTFTFIPNTDTLQTGVFQYNIRCGVDFATSIVQDTATVTVKIMGSNLINDSFTVLVNTPVSGLISNNDVISCPGGVITKSVNSVKNGIVSYFNTTSGDFTFTPNTNFVGSTDFNVNVYCNIGNGPIFIGTQKVFINVLCPSAIPTICVSKTPSIPIDECLQEKDIHFPVAVSRSGTVKLYNKNKVLLSTVQAEEGVIFIPISPAKLGDAYYVTLTEITKTESLISNIVTVCKKIKEECCEQTTHCLPIKTQCCSQYDEPSCCH